MAQAKASGRRGGRTTSRGRASSAAETGTAMQEPLCSVAFCPICTAVTAFGEARPDLVEHLVMAGREVLLALRALIDARLEGAGEPPSKLERLTVE